MKKESNGVLILGIVMVVMGILGLYANAQAPQPTDPNSIADPNAVKMPEGVNMPVRLKCPAHGIIGKAYIVIETDNGAQVYCGQCAKTLVARIFDENLPKLEVLK